MDPDDADIDREDDGDENRPAPRSSEPIDVDSVGGWFWICLLTVLIFRCNGVSLW